MRTLSRDELYALVWARPMTKIGEELGVSGTALKKTCDRHEIPTPERGYWAKLEHGKPVRKAPLPKLKHAGLDKVRVAGNVARRLPDAVRQAKLEAQRRVSDLTQSAMPAVEQGEHPALSATRKAIMKARSGERDFRSASGQGIIGMSVAPANIDRALDVLSRLLRLVEADGHEHRVTDQGLVLVVDEEPVAFTLEEKSARTPHEPTPKELKQKTRDPRWGSIEDPWPQYDYSPSGRLALVIQENSYAGLRRTYADGKVRAVEMLLPEVLAGLIEHAALKKSRRLKAEEERRLSAMREARRQREAAFEGREKRRIEFIDAINAALIEKSKLERVLAHLEATEPEERPRIETMADWLRLRLKQVEALLSPVFVDISARSAEIDFTEPKSRETDQSYFYAKPAVLQFWSIDEEKGMATSQSAFAWSAAAGHLAAAELNEGI